MRTARQMIIEYQKRAENSRRAQEAANKAYHAGLRDQSPAQYQDLLDAFWAACLHAWPSPDPQYLDRLNEGHHPDIERAIAFLEADPWFFRSGYLKQALLTRLKRVPLSRDQAQRLRAVLLNLIDTRDRHEFRYYCHLARALWTPEFEEALIGRMSADDPNIRRRATWMMRAAGRLRSA
jgi:hypothetical protein